MRGRSVCADCGELDSPEDPCLCLEGARTCRVDLIYEATPRGASTKGEEVKLIRLMTDILEVATEQDQLRESIAELTAKLATVTEALKALKAETAARVAAERGSEGMAQRLAYVLAECGGSCAMHPDTIAKVDKTPWQISTEYDRVTFTNGSEPIPLLRYRITFRPEVNIPAVSATPEPRPDPFIIAVDGPEPEPFSAEAAPEPNAGTPTPDGEIQF